MNGGNKEIGDIEKSVSVCVGRRSGFQIMAEHGEDKITEKIHNHDSSSSDSDTEKKVKYDDVKNKDDNDKVTSSK
ncbi:hypothetical protein Tco_0362883, partial [Tanacetum coccineum]